jgi:hypothetical protein
VVGRCFHDDESLGSMEQDFLDRLSGYQLLKKDFAL